MQSIFIVEDDESIVKSLSAFLSSEGFSRDMPCIPTISMSREIAGYATTTTNITKAFWLPEKAPTKARP